MQKQQQPALPDARRGARIGAYAAVLVAIWMAAMAARLYPGFGNTLRVEGRVTTVEDYIADSCTARIGLAAETCLTEAQGEARILLRREQAKSVLLILAPAMIYFLFMMLSGAARLIASWRDSGAAKGS
jgi:hypothetical protein